MDHSHIPSTRSVPNGNHRGQRLFFLGSLVLLVLGSGVRAEWTVSHLLDKTGQPKGCHLITDTVTIHDGYDNTQVSIAIYNATIFVHTESILDTSFNDIGLQVDTDPFIAMTKAQDRKTAVFDTDYAILISQFKKGTQVRVQLRFWPIWPVTGTHDAMFSLIGFTKAYEAFVMCQ
jgi:hypothetical protein